MKNKQFTPKLFSLIATGISRKQVMRDILSGIIVGIVALPLAIAFAIASGVSPDKGLVTAVIAGLIISALGGSRVQIGGPTGAFIVIVYAIVQDHGVSGLTIATFMAGFLIIGFGLARLGDLLKFIPYPLIVGFTSGIALIIFSSQIKDFLGLSIDTLPANFIEKWRVYFENFTQVNWYAFVIALATVFISLNFYRITTKIPGSVVAILLSTLAVLLFKLPVETIETQFGQIPNRIPLPSIPKVDFNTIKALIQPAFAIAFLGAIESLLSAVVADGMIGGRHRSNMELVAQGTANIFSAVFGGIPATGAIARTATNIKNGGRTPIAGIIHALVLLLIMLLFAPLAKLIPLATLAGILVVVAWHMGEWHLFVTMLKSNRKDVIILLTTFLLTVIFDLVIAIEIGVVLSSFFFMKRMSDSLIIRNSVDILGEQAENGDESFEEEALTVPKGVVLYEIHGPLFFGASQKFQDTLLNLHQKPEILILRMRNVPFMDATGAYHLKQLVKHLKSQNIEILLSGVGEEVKEELEKSGFHELVGRANMLSDIQEALKKSREILKLKRNKTKA
ncbi:MAG: sulfate permease [Lewinellaceae bacterium]|nr:sulfate permease [Phaeodactylibacter sp.]MCB9350077.1 sulfate permease [Lewinellaceae bacterium]